MSLPIPSQPAGHPRVPYPPAFPGGTKVPGVGRGLPGRQDPGHGFFRRHDRDAVNRTLGSPADQASAPTQPPDILLQPSAAASAVMRLGATHALPLAEGLIDHQAHHLVRTANTW